MTLREVSIVMQGADFRQEQAARLALVTARTAAIFVRYPRNRRIPTVDSLMRDKGDRKKLEYRTPREQRSFLMDWARRAQAAGFAVKIGRLPEPEKPFGARRRG